MKSKLKISSFLLILFINFLTGILFWTIFIKDGLRIFDFQFWRNGTLIWILIFCLEFFCLSLLFQLKTITIEKDKITFKKLVFPFIKKVRFYNHYDYSKLVEEQSKSGSYESLWLFKNGKLEDQISSFYYSNYSKLKSELKVQNKGKLKLNTFQQISLKLGRKL